MASTVVLETNFEVLKEYWQARDCVVKHPEDVAIFDNLVIGMLSSRIPKDKWQDVLRLAKQRFHDPR